MEITIETTAAVNLRLTKMEAHWLKNLVQQHKEHAEVTALPSRKLFSQEMFNCLQQTLNSK